MELVTRRVRPGPKPRSLTPILNYMQVKLSGYRLVWVHAKPSYSKKGRDDYGTAVKLCEAFEGRVPRLTESLKRLQFTFPIYCRYQHGMNLYR